MYGMQDERKPQDAPKVALTHQERMRREEAKKAIAADKDPMLAQINEGDLATPELRRLAAEFPQLMLPPDDPSRMSVPPEIVVRASLLLKQRDDNASQNSTAIIDESLRRREVRNSFGMILGYGDPAGTARIDLTGMRAPGTETAEEIRYGEMRARERREREWGEALAKIGGMTTDMIMALGGAMGQMGSGPRMQTSPGMLGLRDGQRITPGEWNRPGSQMGTWWESLPTAAQQGMNVGARSAKMRGEVPMITPEGPISLTRSRQPGEPLQPTLQGGVAASQIAGASATPRLTGTTPALQLSEGTRQGMVSTPTTLTEPLQLGMMQRTSDALPLTSPEIKLLPASSTPSPTEPAKQKTTAQLRAELSDQLRMAQKVGDKQAIAEIKERLKTISKPNEPKGATVQPRTLADVAPKNFSNLAIADPDLPKSTDAFWIPSVQVFEELYNKYPDKMHTFDEWMTLAEREYPGVISKQEKSAIKKELSTENWSWKNEPQGIWSVFNKIKEWMRPARLDVISATKPSETRTEKELDLAKASTKYYQWLVKPSSFDDYAAPDASQEFRVNDYVDIEPYTLVTQTRNPEFKVYEHHYDKPSLNNLVSRVRGQFYKDEDDKILLISELQRANSPNDLDDLPIEETTRFTSIMAATYNDIVKRNSSSPEKRTTAIEIAAPDEIDRLYHRDAPTEQELAQFQNATARYSAPEIPTYFADDIKTIMDPFSTGENVPSNKQALTIAKQLVELAQNDPNLSKEKNLIYKLFDVSGFSNATLNAWQPGMKFEAEDNFDDGLIGEQTWKPRQLTNLANEIRLFAINRAGSTNRIRSEIKKRVYSSVDIETPYGVKQMKFDDLRKLFASSSNEDEIDNLPFEKLEAELLKGKTAKLEIPRSKLRNMYINRIYPEIISWGKRHGIHIYKLDNGRLRMSIPRNAKPKSMPIAKVALTKRDRSDALA